MPIDSTPTPLNTSTTADQFIRRIRAALDTAGASASGKTTPPVPPPINEALVRLCGPSDTLVQRFTTGATFLGMSVHPTSRAMLVPTLTMVVKDTSPHAPSSVAVSLADAGLSSIVHEAVQRAHSHVRNWRDKAGLDAHYDADIGITDVDAGLAETGSIVLRSDAARSRGTFLVPPIHIAIVFADQILPDLLDYWTKFPGPPPTSLVFVSGPSKTADIEGILVTGVHGPKAVHIVLVTV